ncbi:MAG: alpha-glucan family phosphorylase [candidate division KSB1 bacterium]|nr:alpha-glucan family phosphorylase [candidate division KSB1 bacterium]MDZ7296097.1 alpha-glucan family phosphorylase [candidate division KSB1 bacterium]MDZ7392036.1 alpha-glucan family phosphorylase [candidate division KSB1 bacterium]
MAREVVAYFSMEIGLEQEIPTYSGGLGVLAGDTIRSAAAMRVPLVAVTLLHRKGYFRQELDGQGRQVERPVEWDVEDHLVETKARVPLTIEGRTVYVRAWKYVVRGPSGFDVPVFFLDTDLPENNDWDRTLTHYLYGGDAYYRLCQEAILGIAGVRILRALGYQRVIRYHLNEGHAALLTLELLADRMREHGRTRPAEEDIEAVRRLCVFTTHTPVPAGHDKFDLGLVQRVLGAHEAMQSPELYSHEGVLNMTFLALNLSHYINGVAKRHQEVSRHMFAQYTVDSITNGVDVGRWAAPPFQELFDAYIPGWREDNFSLRYALSIPRARIWEAHQEAKRRLIDRVNEETGAGMSYDTFTLGFARRATAYKRADLIFRDPERLRQMVAKVGPLQIVFAGKAHPRDEEGKQLIVRIFQAKEQLRDVVRVAYMTNYEIELAKLMVAGVDVWLNTPIPPLEASGTSGMKAAVNGVPSLSILDGWWIEGCIEGKTGWAIGCPALGTSVPDNPDADAAALYDKLEKVVMPLFYKKRKDFLEVMAHAIALNGSFFNTQRMVLQYVQKAYFL